MRVATIGEDGVLRDADGLSYRPGARRQARPAKNEIFLRAREKDGLGQETPIVLSVPTAPQVAPDRAGPAYSSAEAKSVPASKFEFSRSLDASPERYLFPGRIVISGAPEYQVPYTDPSGKTIASGTVFRVGARPANDDGVTWLLAVEGKRVGEYVEVLLTDLLTDKFRVVPPEEVSLVTINYTSGGVLTPYIDGKIERERPTGAWAIENLNQAAYGLATIPVALTPVAFQEAFNQTRFWVVSAMGSIQEGIDMAGAAYDFNRIGKKSLCILAKVAIDLSSWATKLLAKVDLTGPESLLGTTDQAKIDGFWSILDEVNVRVEYWAALLARVQIYQTSTFYNSILSGMLMEESLAELNSAILDGLLANRAEAEQQLTGKMEGGAAVTPERARALVDQAVGLYQYLVGLDGDDRKTLDAGYASLFNADFTKADLPIILSLLSVSLKENARMILEIRKRIAAEGRDVSSPCRERGTGLGQIATAASILASMPVPGPNLARRARMQEAMARDMETKFGKAPSDAYSQKTALKNLREYILAQKTMLKEGIMDAADLLTGGTISEFKVQKEAARKLKDDLIEKSKTGVATAVEVKQARDNYNRLEPEPKALVREAFKQTVDKLELASEKAIGAEGLRPEQVAELNKQTRELYVDTMSDLFRGIDENGVEGYRSYGSAYALELSREEPGTVPDFQINQLKQFRKIITTDGVMSEPVVQDFLCSVIESQGHHPDAVANAIAKQKIPALEKVKNRGPEIAALGSLLKSIKGADMPAFLESIKEDISRDEANRLSEEAKDPKDRRLVNELEVDRIILLLETCDARLGERVAEQGKSAARGSGGVYEEMILRAKEDPKLAAYLALFNRPEVLDRANQALINAKTLYKEFKARFDKVRTEAGRSVIMGGTQSLQLSEWLLRVERALEKCAVELGNLATVYRGFTFSWTRIGMTVKNGFLYCTTHINSGFWELHHSMIARFGARAVYTVLFAPWVLAFALTPLTWGASKVGIIPEEGAFVPTQTVYNLYAGLNSIIAPSGSSDPGPDQPGGGAGAKDKGPGGGTKFSPVTNLILLGVGVSLIFSGGKVFGFVDRIFASLAKVIDSMTKLFTPSKKKKRVGRPSLEPGEGGERRGRGRPPKIDKAKDEVARAEAAVEEAEGSGNEDRVMKARERLEKAEGKLKKAEEAEFFKGLIGNFWRLNNGS